ncbi:hypothetical protein BCEP4_850010 [Burkholderia cepacia]|nr:hypothetical protein BCEP4_850010 [Burkholderia cepacia]
MPRVRPFPVAAVPRLACLTARRSSAPSRYPEEQTLHLRERAPEALAATHVCGRECRFGRPVVGNGAEPDAFAACDAQHVAGLHPAIVDARRARDPQRRAMRAQLRVPRRAPGHRRARRDRETDHDSR